MIQKIVVLSVGLGMLLGGVVLAQAQGDRVVEQDRAVYSRLNIEQRFGVTFRPHTAVCADAGPGEASCNSRVIDDTTQQSRITPDRTGPNRNRSGGGGTPPPPPPPPPSGYGPAQFLKAYNLSGQANGQPVIAIVDAYDDPNITNDLNAYSTAVGIPTLPACSGSGAITNSSVACFQKVNQQGNTSGLPAANAGWALEISLDVEVAHAVCQNCSILLVEASSNSFTNLLAAEDYAAAHATVVSNSWGGSEFAGETGYDSHFNHPGVAFTVSAGDAGYGVEYPAASPYVTAVGGTSLFLKSDGSYNSELAWSGTGSGCSAYEVKSVWQTALGLPGCANRTVADVSADADPNTGAAVYDTVSYSGKTGWFQVGGTSLASPLIAAVYALSGNTGNATVAANAIPYAKTPALHDVTSGSNGSCGGSYLCTALAGFDGPTGLGTPFGLGAF